MELAVKQAILEEEFKMVADFLEENNLRLEENCDKTFYVKDEAGICGTVSLARNVIKCFAVSEKHRQEGIGNTLISHAISDLYLRDIFSYLVFTKIENVDTFQTFSLKLVAQTDTIALLENHTDNVQNVVERIRESIISTKKNAALVMNCNPMTNGHLYLIEKAAAENDLVLLFLVEEDMSVFPFLDRYKIVEKATAHLTNVRVIPSTKYIISLATFPTYFLDDEDQVTREHARLDVTIFKDYFMQALDIKKRYVGEEPYSHRTDIYNNVLKEELGDQLVIVPRIKHDDDFISASRVRAMLKEGRIDDIKDMVPEATYDYLTSDEGREIILKLDEA